MKVVLLSGSIIGSKTKIAMENVLELFKQNYPNIDVQLLDLAQYKMDFSDGRNYFEYEGDTKFIAESMMEADAIVIGTPIFQASIPATLKNVFDLLPVNAFRDKVISSVVTAGSPKHYLVIEQQLKPILAYMKAQIVPTYVFIEEKDFLREEIVNDDILFRLERLVEDTVLTTEAFESIRIKKDEEYDF